jgi:hypothetical protein
MTWYRFVYLAFGAIAAVVAVLVAMLVVVYLRVKQSDADAMEDPPDTGWATTTWINKDNHGAG